MHCSPSGSCNFTNVLFNSSITTFELLSVGVVMVESAVVGEEVEDADGMVKGWYS